MDIQKLKFDENGLIPAIIVDDENSQVLTLAYMNLESLQITSFAPVPLVKRRDQRQLSACCFGYSGL